MKENIKKLHLSKTDRKITGVCGGIGETFKIDSTIVRSVFVFIALVTAVMPAIMGYIIAWLLIPSNSSKLEN